MFNVLAIVICILLMIFTIGTGSYSGYLIGAFFFFMGALGWEDLYRKHTNTEEIILFGNIPISFIFGIGIFVVVILLGIAQLNIALK